MKLIFKHALLLVIGTTFMAGSLRADLQLTGTYSLGDGSDGNQATGTGTGPFTLTATNTPNTFSYVDFIPDIQTYTFADLTNLNSVFNSSTEAYGGSPRISVELSNGVEDSFIHIYLGTSPSYDDTAASLNTYSGFNMIGNNDAGRYDTSNFTGGSPFTTYSSTLSMLGSYEVKDISFVVDTFTSDRSVELDSINAFVSVAAVPEPGTWAAGLLAAVALAALGIRRKLPH
jgi:PEP-CTERM motif